MIESIKQSFLNPQEEYTPIPFWFWNDTLTEQEIIRQIHDFHEKGVNGFVIHSRIGIPEEIAYLSDCFMEFVTCAVSEAEKLGMKVVLYDEAMYPSGSAHGMVVKNHPEYASKGLKVVEYKCNGRFEQQLSVLDEEKIISVQAVQKNSDSEINPKSVRKIELILNKISFQPENEDNWSVLVFIETYTKGHIRGIHFGEDDGEPNAPASSDLLNIDAMKEFIKLTHDRYYEVLKKYFGTTIIGMFTDEPCIMGRGDMAGLLPWTGHFLEYYIEQGNSELDLPCLWFDADDISEKKKRKYEEAVNKKMEESYYKPIYEWCDKHQIALTGHPHDSDDIGFLKYFHMPAQDVVWRWVAPEDGLAITGEHSTMAKCTSDSARHRGMRRNGNECFACCGSDKVEWAFTADDMKWYMDWLFVRGVNLLFPHAFFYSIDGPRRIGERPPDVGPNNIWWPQYNQISDYIKRMSYLLTDSVNHAQVAVLCGAHQLPWQIVKPLYENQIEFNYLENELLVSDACQIEGKVIKIANQTYRVLLIEDNKLIDEDNSNVIQTFINNGGCVIVYNPNKEELIIKNMTSLLEFDNIVVKINDAIQRDFITSTPVKNLRVSHITKESTEFYILVNEGEDEIVSNVTLNTVGSLEKWDAFKGRIEIADMIEKISENSMEINLRMKRREAIVLFVNTKAVPKVNPSIAQKTATQVIEIKNDWYMGTALDKLQKIEELKPWNTISGLQHFSGSMIYQNIFTINQRLADEKVELYLGEVHEIVKVTLNKKEVGVLMWGPYTFDVTEFIKDGANELTIEVKNTLANRICNLSLQSGLVGPVNVKSILV